ncbi:hypothetical protein CBL_00669 [Carabus blaptoides fortunei]
MASRRVRAIDKETTFIYRHQCFFTYVRAATLQNQRRTVPSMGIKAPAKTNKLQKTVIFCKSLVTMVTLCTHIFVVEQMHIIIPAFFHTLTPESKPKRNKTNKEPVVVLPLSQS